MRRVIQFTISISLLLCLRVMSAELPPARFDEKHREFLKSYCIECHNEKKTKGKLRLDDVSFALDSLENAERWQKILNQLNSGEMPPEDAKQPERVAKTEFLDALSHTLVAARKTLGDSGGTITMRRLNRREYKNTIRDVLGVEIAVNELPSDGGAGTFDTVGSSMFMSSDQIEQYLALGRQALDENFSRNVSPSAAQSKRMHVEAEATNERIAKGLKQRLDDHERYVKWTTAVDVAAAKTENAEAVAKIRAEKKTDATHVYAQWQRIKGAPSPKEFGFVDHINADEQGRRDWVHYVPYHRAYMEHPLAKTGAFLTIEDSYVNTRQMFQIPREWPAGDYVVRARLAALDGIPKERRFVEFGPQDPSGVCTVSSTHEITGTIANPQVLEIPLKVSPTSARVYMFRERGSHESDAASNRLFSEAKQRNGVGPEFALWMDWIDVESRHPNPTTATSNEKPQTFRLEPETVANPHIEKWVKDAEETSKRFQPWQAKVDRAAAAAENQDIIAKLKLEDPHVGKVDFKIYYYADRLKGAPKSEDFGLGDTQNAAFLNNVRQDYLAYFRHYLTLPHRQQGAYLTINDGYMRLDVKPNIPLPPGHYILRLKVGAVEGTPTDRHFIEIGAPDDEGIKWNLKSVSSSHQITGTVAHPQILEVPIQINLDTLREFSIRERQPGNFESARSFFYGQRHKNGYGPDPAIWVDWVELEGPVNASAPVLAVSKTIKERREVEEHANRMVGGTYNGYYKGGYTVLVVLISIARRSRTQQN